jgi:DNA-directed RNA polymerase specialized sigma24 family protein
LYRTGLRLALDYLKRERHRARYEGLARLFRAAPNPHHEVEQQHMQVRVRQVLASLQTRAGPDALTAERGVVLAELAAALEFENAD